MPDEEKIQQHRRGIAAVAMIIVLLMLNLIIVGMVRGATHDQSLTELRLETVQAFYATEAGINMGLREVLISTDEDNDGTVGTISDDGDDNTDPAIGTARVVVSQALAAGRTTLTSRGRAGNARRQAQAAFE